MALAVVGAPGVDTCVLAAPVMDLALVDICSRKMGWWLCVYVCVGGRGGGEQRQESGRQMGDKLAQFDKIFPIMERERKKKRPHDGRPRCAARTREELNAGL